MSMIIELRRKVMHFIFLLALPLLMYFSEQDMIRLAAFLVLVIGGIHWYVDRRQKRWHKYREALSGLKELIGSKLSKKDESDLDRVEALEEHVLKNTFLKFGRKRQEGNAIRPTVYFVLGVLMALIFFGKLPIIFGVIALAFGDSFSTLIGQKYGKHKLFFNKDKSWEGLIAFLVSTTIAVFVFVTYVPSLQFLEIWKLVLITAVAGAFIEAIPTIDDNLTIPLGVSLLLWLAVLF